MTDFVVREQQGFRRIAISSFLFVLVIFVLIATITFQYGYTSTKEQFQSQATNWSIQIEQRLNEVNAVISSLVALQHYSTQFNSRELVLFSQGMIENYPHVYSIQFAAPVRLDEKADFEAIMDEEGYESLKIRQLDSNGNLRPADARALYLPVSIVEPVRPETTWLYGFDLASNPAIRQTVKLAIESGQLVNSSVLDLPLVGKALMIFKAVYKGRIVPLTKEERKQQFAGVYMVILMPQHLLASIDFGREKNSLGQIVVRERNAVNPDQGLLYQHGLGSRKSFNSLLPDLKVEITLNGLDDNVVLEFGRPVGWRDVNLGLILFEFLFASVAYLILFKFLFRSHRSELEKEHTKDELYREKDRAEVTLHSITDAVVTTDTSGNIEYMNEVAEKIIGLPRIQAKGIGVRTLIRIEDEATRNEVDEPVSVVLDTEETIRLTRIVVINKKSLKEYAVNLTVSTIHDRTGNAIGTVLVFHDISTERSLARELAYKATHDDLTGLLNRHEFEVRIKSSIADVRTKDKPDTVWYMDLDQFKVVNDTCGHLAGDELLRQLTALLKNRLRGNDVLARLGGDEFGVLLQDCNVDDAYKVAESIRQMINHFRFFWDEKSFEIGVSIGLVEVTSDFGNVSDVLKAADSACYMAKDNGRNRIYIFQHDDDALAVRHGEMQWLHRIQKAFEENRFFLVQQEIRPITSDNLPPHREILLRMMGEDGNVIPPMAFIPAAERYDLMFSIDIWVIRKAFAVIAEEKSDFIYNINISGQSVCNETFYDLVIDEFDKYKVPASRICFEVTETAAIANIVSASRFMLRLKELGCYFALDDFGSGLSSFAYLRDLPVDFLKIDGIFVKNMTADEIDAAMVDAINEIGHVMGIRTIAEFVENDAVLARLRDVGVDFVQGYGIAKPVNWYIPDEAQYQPGRS